MSGHVLDLPVGTTAYQRGCRCDGCRTAQRDYLRAYRSTANGRTRSRVETRAINAAVKWVRANHPEQWAAFVDEARVELGLPVQRWKRQAAER